MSIIYCLLKGSVMYLCPYRVESILLNIKSFLLTVYHQLYHPEVTVLQFTNLKKYQTTCSSPKYMLHYVTLLHILFSLFILALVGYCSLIHQNPTQWSSTHYIVQAVYHSLIFAIPAPFTVFIDSFKKYLWRGYVCQAPHSAPRI